MAFDISKLVFDSVYCDWWLAQSKYYDNEIKLFEETYPYIKIKRTKTSVSRYVALVEMAARNNTLPDIMAIPPP